MMKKTRTARVAKKKVQKRTSLGRNAVPSALLIRDARGMSLSADVVPLRNSLHRFSLLSKASAFVLVLFFLTVPLSDAYANEGELSISEVHQEVVESAPTLDEVSPEIDESEKSVQEDTPSSEEEIATLPEEVIQNDDSVPIADADEEVVVPRESDDISESASSTESSTEVDTASLEEVLVSEISTSTLASGDSESSTDQQATGTTAATPDTPHDAATTTTPGDPPTEVPSETPASTTTPELTPVEESLPELAPEPATSTDEMLVIVASGTLPEMGHTTDASRLSFGLTECVPVGNGAFHCVKRDAAVTSPHESEIVYAAPDEDGDLEIFYNNGASKVKITNNLTEDDAPLYDAEGDSIVWHSLIDDRYQIVSYDLDTKESVRVTKGTGNSMQPASYDNTIVYQSWIGADWEIVLVDEDGDVEQLTDNDAHDITPSINDEYITWQSDEGGEWVVRVYDRKTGHIETVRGVEGGKVENPRMVLVFDSKLENGDIETVGYDMKSGEVVPLSATPAPLPERIPVPEQEQEQKALIQPSVALRIETKATSTPSGSDDGVSSDDIGTTTPEIVSGDLIITSGDAHDEATTTESQVEVPTLDLSEGTAPDPSSARELPLIPDLIVPALNTTPDETGSST